MARPRFDRRTIAIGAVIALLGASVAALITALVLSDGEGDAVASAPLQLTDQGDVDVAALLAAPLATPDGEAVDLGDLLDERPLLVNFWQSSCAPCITEMPLLDQAATDRADELDVVGIATVDQPDKAAELAAQTEISYPWVLDDVGTAFTEARAAGMPTTVLLDADGAVLASETGAFADGADLDRFIDDGLGG